MHALCTNLTGRRLRPQIWNRKREWSRTQSNRRRDYEYLTLRCLGALPTGRPNPPDRSFRQNPRWRLWHLDPHPSPERRSRHVNVRERRAPNFGHADTHTSSRVPVHSRTPPETNETSKSSASDRVILGRAPRLRPVNGLSRHARTRCIHRLNTVWLEPSCTQGRSALLWP